MSIPKKPVLSRGAAAVATLVVGAPLVIAAIGVDHFRTSPHAVGQSAAIVGSATRAVAADLAISRTTGTIVVQAEYMIDISHRAGESTARGTEYMIDTAPAS
jgi:hypothetical protein